MKCWSRVYYEKRSFSWLSLHQPTEVINNLKLVRGCRVMHTVSQLGIPIGVVGGGVAREFDVGQLEVDQLEMEISSCSSA